jgi:hypothetical protein
MQEIPRALLLPPPSLHRPNHRAGESDSESAVAARNARRQSHGAIQGAAQPFLTLVETPQDDTVEIKGKQFRFRPYSNRGATSDEIVRESDLADELNGAGTIDDTAGDGEITTDILDGFGSGAQRRNSSAFTASVIAQEHLSEGLYNPQYAAASDAYRRAGGSPSAIDNQPRVFSFAV